MAFWLVLGGMAPLIPVTLAAPVQDPEAVYRGSAAGFWHKTAQLTAATLTKGSIHRLSTKPGRLENATNNVTTVSISLFTALH